MKAHVWVVERKYDDRKWRQCSMLFSREDARTAAHFQWLQGYDVRVRKYVREER